MTTTPRMLTLSSTKRIASTAAWSALSFSPRPIQRAAAIAPASVTRTSSIAMLRSGACRCACIRLAILHSLRRLDPDQVEGAGDHALRGPAQREAKRLLVALEHAMLVVEAVEVVRDADRVRRQPLRAALLDSVGDDGGELGEPLHE